MTPQQISARDCFAPLPVSTERRPLIVRASAGSVVLVSRAVLRWPWTPLLVKKDQGGIPLPKRSGWSEIHERRVVTHPESGSSCGDGSDVRALLLPTR